MEWVETTGRSVEEAKDSALDQLGVDEQDVEFDVLEEPKLGLFGRIRSEARVRARIKPASPRAKDDGRDRRRRRMRTATTDDSAPQDVSPASAASPRSTRTKPPAPPAPANDDQRESEPMERTREDVEVPVLAQAEAGRTFLAGLLRSFGLAGDIEVSQRTTAAHDEEVVDLLVTGPDLGLLIGPQGGTLNAIQEVTRTVVQRQTGARNGRLLVDVGGYRAKRAEALERFVREVAAKVRASGERMALEPMHAADRKVVHDTVNTIEGVSTISEGEEPRRRVVLEPAAG